VEGCELDEKFDTLNGSSEVLEVLFKMVLGLPMRDSAELIPEPLLI